MKWLSILKINVLILLALLISVMILIFNYYKIKKKYTNKEALCKSWKAIEIILKFNYNGTHNIDFNYLKMVIGKVFIPMSEKNAFWIDTKTIQLNNITYDSDKGSVGLKELILTKDKIEIVYDVHSKSTGVIDLVKTKGSTELTINNKTYICKVDQENKRILVPCSGYSIFNDSKVSLKSNLQYCSSFELAIKTDSFLDKSIDVDFISLCRSICIINLSLSFVIAVTLRMYSITLLLFIFLVYRFIFNAISIVCDTAKESSIIKFK